MAKLGLPTTGGADGVTVIKQGFNVDPLIQKQADCISTMTYNEYWQVIDAGIPADQLVVFKYEDQGVATLEDGLYAMEDKLKDPAFLDKMARFVKASMKGWDYARAHPDEAVKIVLDNDSTGAQTEHHQTQMMAEINKLTDGSDGRLDPAAYQQTVKALLSSGGSDPVISKEPTGAYTAAVTDKALGK
jgi:NitT/TauT family transport system substrate-binding protein